MDLYREKTTATEHDSDEDGESFYLSRLHADLNEQSSLERQHSQEVLKTQKHTEGQIYTEANTMATRMFKKQKDALIRTVKPLNVTSKAQSSNSPFIQSLSQDELHKEVSLFDKCDLKPNPVLRHFVKKHVKPGKKKFDPEIRVKRKKTSPCRSLWSKLSIKGRNTKASKKIFNLPLPTHVKQRLQVKPYISQGFCGKGIINPKTRKVLTLANIHKQNLFEETKVHLAVMQEDTQAVKNMIKVGASVNMTDNTGKADKTLLKNAHLVAEESSSDSFHDYNSDCQITDKRKPSQSMKGGSHNVHSAKATSAGKRVLEDCEDSLHYITNVNDSTMAKKKIKTTKCNTQTEFFFLEYLLNFDLNQVSVPSKRDSHRSLLQLNKNVSKDQQWACQKFLSETFYISDTNNDNSKECSPHLCVSVDSYLQGSFQGNINKHTSVAKEDSSLQRKELFALCSPGSQSLCVIHNQGLTCSPECSDEDELFEKISTCKQQQRVPETLSKDPLMAQLPYHDVRQQQRTVPSASCATKPTAVDTISATPSNTLCLLKPLNHLKKVDHQTMSIKHNQQGAIKIPLSTGQTSAKKVSTRNTGNHSMECKTLVGNTLILKGSETNLMDGPVEPNWCRNTELSVSEPMRNVHLFNVNDVLANTWVSNTPLPCNVKHPENSTRAVWIVIRDDTFENFTDSDCTVMEHLCQSDTVTDIQDKAIKTILNKLSSSEERHTEMGMKNKDSTQDTIASVSVLRQLSSKHVCSRLSFDNIHHNTPSLNFNGPHMAVKDKNLPNTTEKKSKKSKHGKQQKRSLKPDSLKEVNEPDVLTTAVSNKALKTSQKALHKRNGLGETYLHQACMKGDLQWVKCLIDAGINVNISDNAGWTALHEASVRGFADVVKQLLEAGANVTIRGLDGCTPLHDAVKSDSYEIVRLLLQFGSSPYDKNMLGQNAADLSADESIKELLLTFKRPFHKPGQTTNNSKQGSAKHVKPVQCEDITVRPKQETRCRSKCCKESTTDTLCGQSHIIKIMLEDAEQKQNKMAAWKLRDAKDYDKFNEALSEVHTLLKNVVLKQQEAKNDLTRKYRIASGVFCHGILKEQITDLASCQKHLLTVLQKQNKLKQKGFTHKASFEHNGSINDNNKLQITLKSFNHKAFNHNPLVHNASVKVANGRVFFFPEHCVESLLGKNVPLTSDVAWKKVYQSKSLWDYAFNTNSNMKAPKGSQLECCTFNVSTVGPTLKEKSRNEAFMNIKSIHLISNKDFVPSHMINRYWNLFKNKEEWTLET